MYCFSGTGNALTTGRWLADRARRKHIPSEIIPIDRFKRPVIAPAGKDILLGFLYPTHGFNLPWYMLKFMLAFPRGHGHIFCLNTFGGTKLGRFHLPGLSGLALILPALLFFLKGYRVRGLVSINLPSNWISVHPGLTPSAVASLAEHCRSKTFRFAEKLLSRRRSYRGLISLPFDLAVSPVALGYFFVGRFWLAKMYMANSKCNGCGICEKNCPVDALVMKENRPFWTFRCESCMRCLNICPPKAIQVSHLFTAITAFCLYGLLFPLILFFALSYNEKLGFFLRSDSMSIGMLRAWLFIGIMFLAYRLIQRLAKFRLINFIFAGLSLTRLPFWRRYLAPGISAKDFRTKK